MAFESLTYETLLQQASVFHTGYFERAKKLMEQLATEGQKPQVMFVGCSDSRAVPEYITQARPGDLFVVRTIANIIPGYGVSESAAGSAIEYAVRHLGIGHLVVCGHTDCGGIKALEKRMDLLQEPSLVRWLKYAQPILQRVAHKGGDPAARQRAMVEANVGLQLEQAQSYACVREALQKGSLALHGWVYDIHTGQVTVVE